MNRRFLHTQQRSRVVVLVGFIAAVSAAACTEKLESGAACPLLCPQQSVQLKDTVVDAVAIDSTQPGYPPIGQENELLLAARGDTLDTRVIVRFDTLPKAFTNATTPADSVINAVDSARLQVILDSLVIPSTPAKPTVPVTIELYDVDGPATDTVAADLLPLFTAARLLGSRTFAPESLKDTLRVPVNNAVVLDRIKQGTRLRVGMKLVSGQSTQLRFFPQGTNGPRLRFKPTNDTTLTVDLRSNTPTDSNQVGLKTNLADYVIVAKGLPPRPPLTILAGGYPAYRTYIRFDLPLKIVDSSTVVRASLLLTQYPQRASPSANDSVAIYAVPITAGTPLTDVSRLLALAPTISGAQDSLRLVPGDTGVRRLELVNIVRVWGTTKPLQTQRAIVIRVASEGLNPARLAFFSSQAGEALRPRLQLTYVPRVDLGLP